MQGHKALTCPRPWCLWAAAAASRAVAVAVRVVPPRRRRLWCVGVVVVGWVSGWGQRGMSHAAAAEPAGRCFSSLVAGGEVKACGTQVNQNLAILIMDGSGNHGISFLW